MSANEMGFVRADDKPVAGATVYIVDADMTSFPAPCAAVLTTDAMGRFTVPELPPGRYIVSPEHQRDGNWYSPVANTRYIIVPPPTDVVSVSLAPIPAAVNIGEQLTLTAAARDVNGQPLAGKAYSWASLSPEIATVNSSGIVTGVALGDAVIRVICDGVSATVTVTVTYVPVPTTVEVLPATVTLTVDPTPRPTTIEVTPATVVLTYEPPDPPVPTTVEVTPSTVELTLE